MLGPLLLAAFASVASAQHCPANDPAIYPNSPLIYPMTSDRYAVQYKLGSGDWTDAQVYVSYYGGTNASPSLQYAPYTLETSMSFASIPVRANANVQLRVTKLWDAPFLASDHVAVRPGAKRIDADLMRDGTVQISTRTEEDFAGEQFILWWDRGTEGGGIEGLAFFLDPPYDPPTGNKVKTITALTPPADLLPGNLLGFDTLAFEGNVAIPGSEDTDGAGAQPFFVPVNIDNIFLAQGSWVQGKLRFKQSGAGHVRRIYGPGVLDVSRFNYMWRQCRNATTYPGSDHIADGFPSVSLGPLVPTSPGPPPIPDRFVLDGIIVTDSQYTAVDDLANGVVNNIKIISWNGNNDGLRFGQGTRASNVFVRDGDDSLEMWGPSITVTNATVWQNYDGGVVNLGWSNKYPGDDDRIDGLYVVKTDWNTPQDNPCWIVDPQNVLSHQNNAIIVSLMTPGTNFGTVHPPVYKNIYVDDTPRVLLSLKILPPDCNLGGLKTGGCPHIDLRQPSVVKLNIENVFTPASTLNSSIGFQTLPAGYTFTLPDGSTVTLPADYTLTGSMNIGLTNVLITLPDGRVTALTSENAAVVGKVVTHGNNVYVDIDRHSH
jgi:hypothetical protein